MPRIENPCDWIIERLKTRRPLFAVRYNDGEMQMMYRTVPEGKVLGTDANPAPANYELGDELREMLKEIGERGPDDILIGCSWNTPRADAVCEQFGLDAMAWMGDRSFNWCNEHWPLDGVVDGSTRRMLEAMPLNVCLVTCEALKMASLCFHAGVIETVTADSWQDRHRAETLGSWLLEKFPQTVFIWAAGCGLKPTAWRLFKEFPQSSHIDVGHLFNGAFGVMDYGWLQRQDGPWWGPYMEPGGFKDWVRSFVK